MPSLRAVLWLGFGLSACQPASYGPGGPLPQYDPGGNGFFDHPFPSDARRDSDGTLSVAGFPNPFAVSLVTTYLDRAEQLDGFGNNSPIHIAFDGPVDPRAMPTPEASLQPGSALVLVDIDRQSPFFGERFPVQWEQFAFDGSLYAPEHLLSIAPVFGFPLRPATKYALIVTRDIADRNPQWASSWSDVDYNRALPELGIDPDSVAIATAFTTQDPVDEMALFAWYVQNVLGPPELDLPLEHLFEHSTYTSHRTHYPSPVFTHGDPPYSTQGGNFVVGDDGLPRIAYWDDLRVAVCTPKGLPTPETGWPVVIFQHGTGGAYRGFCDSDGALEAMTRFGEAGIIGLGLDQPLHGMRPGGDTASDLNHFNIVNPDAATSNFRQGALDAIYLARTLARRPYTFRTEKGEQFQTDPERVMFMGHSQGGLTGALAAPFFAGDVSAAMISGAGGVLAITIVERKDPLDFAALVRQLLAFPDEEPLTPLHPAIGLVQMLVEITDPVNYAPYWFSQRGDWENHLPTPVLVTSGTLDAATPYRTAIAMAAAGRVPLIGEPATRADAIRMRVGPPRALPQFDTVRAFTGTRNTSGFAQYYQGTHFVVFEEPAASDLVINWLESTAAGSPFLWAEE